MRCSSGSLAAPTSSSTTSPTAPSRRLGLGYDVLARENPRIIYMALKGFLPGPYEARPFLDELAQMSAGLAFMTGPRGQPMRAGASIVDVGAAAYGVIAVLAALQQRAQTGRGQKITSGLYETTVFWVGQWLANYGATGEPSVPMPEIRQGTRMGWGIYQLFTAADGEQVFVGITSNAPLGAVLQGVRPRRSAGRRAPERQQQARGGTGVAAGADRRGDAEVSERRAGRAAGACEDPVRAAAPARPAGGRSAPERVRAVDRPRRCPARPPAKLPKMPVRSSAYEFSLRRPAPRLGEHTREVLQEFGLSKDDIDALASRRVIG